ncbi:hypothetical protein ACOJBQ_002416 [Cronobacter muytjensii]|nr:hypothetical protein [Cronobacter muytjensii]
MAGLLLSISYKFLFIAALSIKSSVNSKTCVASLFLTGIVYFLLIFIGLILSEKLCRFSGGRECFAARFLLARGVSDNALRQKPEFYAVFGRR